MDIKSDVFGYSDTESRCHWYIRTHLILELNHPYLRSIVYRFKVLITLLAHHEGHLHRTLGLQVLRTPAPSHIPHITNNHSAFAAPLVQRQAPGTPVAPIPGLRTSPSVIHDNASDM
jgi:hypothetical protein